MIINLFSPGNLDPADSYGLIACRLAEQLAGMGHYINALPLGSRIIEGQSPLMREIALHPIHTTFGGIYLGWPTTYADHSSIGHHGPRIAVSMFETTKIPDGWAEIFNGFNAVIVPSSFCKEVFERCGVEVPIHVIPLGINDIYQPVPRNGDSPFTFLAFLDRGRRKGYVHAIRSFLMAFGDSTDVRLILKSRNVKLPLEFVNPNVEVIHHDLSEKELYALYLKCHCLINPHKGEGFGLIPREFAASGGIALTTAWSGTADRIGMWGFPLPFWIVPTNPDDMGVKSLEGQEIGEWAQPDDTGIAKTLLEVVQYRGAYNTIAYQRGKWARAFYSWRSFAEGVFEVWKEIADGNGN